MKLLIKDVKPIGYPEAYEKIDVYIEEGFISDIGTINKLDVPTLKAGKFFISPGWFDLRALTNDPGYDHRDDLSSISASAAKGGFTHVFALPNTSPVIQGKESTNYLLQYETDYPVKIIPIPAATKDLKGKDMNDLLDLAHLGLKAFGDGNISIHRADTVILLLQYLQQFNGTLFQFPQDLSFKDFGLIHEGKTSAMTGLKGIPSLSEYLMVKRDIDLLRTYGGKLHFSCISTHEAVNAIRLAKREGLQVSCDTAAHYLAFNDQDLLDFDTNLKVYPPFRTAKDIEALQTGLEDNTIDVVVSDHQGVDYESKNLEFDLADFGISGLETTFSVLNTYSNLSPEKLVEKLSSNPRIILDMPLPKLSVGERCDFTLFNTHEEFILNSADSKSKSKNNPFLGQPLKGRILATCLGNKFSKND